MKEKDLRYARERFWIRFECGNCIYKATKKTFLSLGEEFIDLPKCPLCGSENVLPIIISAKKDPYDLVYKTELAEGCYSLPLPEKRRKTT